MIKEEVTRHMSMKKKFEDYPKLPKFILDGKKINIGLQESCTRGFLKRVKNWETAKYRRELSVII